MLDPPPDESEYLAMSRFFEEWGFIIVSGWDETLKLRIADAFLKLEVLLSVSRNAVRQNSPDIPNCCLLRSL